MADSPFWHDLAAEFRALQTTQGALRADYHYTLGCGVGDWKLKGAGGTGPLQFAILAKRGASALPSPGTSDLLNTWLEALRLASTSFRLELAGIEQNADETEGAHHYTGTILHVCEASADHCIGLESGVLDADFSKEQEKAANGDGSKNRRKTEKAMFPDRAEWLAKRLGERSWNKHDVHRKGGPDQRSVQKILDGRHVREDLLEKLARALSQAPPSKKLPLVNLLDIPKS